MCLNFKEKAKKLAQTNMAENNKDLLHLEATTPSTSCLESKLFVCKKDGAFPLSETPVEKPAMFPVPKILGKVKDFLDVMSESNKKLLNDAKENPNNYDIEVLNGQESEYIELDLMLGVADLHTPEAVAAAESAIAGKQPVIHLPENSSSGSDSDDASDDDDDEEEEEEESVPQSAQVESTDAERDSSRKVSSKQKPKKRPKIVELP
ncbi:hypothetical protein ACJIZ3_011013 [Penstemon smallii]|uniref:Uncharacterized protein n=1 Tax=Penstemon smallii TaxID=265156 RepID=A0ABD3UJL8_9LAMI